MPRLLSPEQAAAEIGVSRAKIWQWIKSGRIRSVKVDSMRRIRPEDIDEFMGSFSPSLPVPRERREASV